MDTVLQALPGWLPAAALAIPMGVAALTKSKAPDWVKNVTGALLSALATGVAWLIENGADGITRDELTKFGWATLVLWAVSLFAYVKFLKDTPLLEWIKNKTAAFGFGKPVIEARVIKIEVPDGVQNVSVVAPATVNAAAPVTQTFITGGSTSFQPAVDTPLPEQAEGDFPPGVNG